MNYIKLNKKKTLQRHHAISIAHEDLLHCISPCGVVAGLHHFIDLWARDSLFATFGANAAGMADVSKKTISTFLRYQRNDGLIPYRILRSPTTIGKYFGKPRYFPVPQSDFRSHQSGGLVLDGGLMTVISAAEYVRVSHDKKFLKKQYLKFSDAMDWYQHRFGEGLLSEWFQCEWADAVLKIGKVLYTNVLYCRALFDMEKLAQSMSRAEDAKAWRTRAETIQQYVNNIFWNGSYFSDWYDYKRQDYFSSGSNMLAVVLGVTTKKQSQNILQFAKQHCWNQFTLESNHPKYPWWRIPMLNYFGGISDYCNQGCLWLQPGILYAVGLFHIGKNNDAGNVLEKIAKKITEYTDVYEVYERDGRPVRRFFYTSEHPFAWSAGLFLWAWKEIFGTL